MAYEIGRRRSVDQQNRTAIGLSLPLRRGNSGYFEQNYTTIEQARSNIRNLMLTRRGERLIQVNFGTNLRSIIFEQIDSPNIEELILDEIETALATWLPYITLENVDIDVSPANANINQAEVSIDFRVGNDIELNTVTFTVEE